jgi:hypothetical protein
VKHKEALKKCHKMLPTALYLDRYLVCPLLHYVLPGLSSNSNSFSLESDPCPSLCTKSDCTK